MLETGWCTKYFTAHSKTNTSSNSQDTDEACLGFDTTAEKYASFTFRVTKLHPVRH